MCTVPAQVRVCASVSAYVRVHPLGMVGSSYGGGSSTVGTEGIASLLSAVLYSSGCFSLSLILLDTFGMKIRREGGR